ncbi:nitroreductase family deazaflavin-dependent oxidoreductase [Streptomyces iconiensis]|uniref:Nitroreductase family deazaflavin-dependent oxidoreductase n=1 Tax=Streptomyces iconiensis TaxID=1384038 RepID=A0ABT6ZQP2_9ACTN|nr:nitroreductase family deazaflavin-dependent oxidoreductase [Streptomyces iconiensis]MDJ1131363.1 nitroreductase family deazaflavin-dependent oxidoreductase [Streptomyces iconiensis]
MSATPAPSTPPTPPAQHVMRPGWFTNNVLNRTVAWLSRRGISMSGSRVLAVRGRKSGEWRRTPVNPLPHGGAVYLVSARGHVQWTRNMRVAGGGELFHGKRGRGFTAVEVPEKERPEILRAYLKKWKWEVGTFFKGVRPDSTDEEFLAAAPRHPVFRITYTD